MQMWCLIWRCSPQTARLSIKTLIKLMTEVFICLRWREGGWQVFGCNDYCTRWGRIFPSFHEFVAPVGPRWSWRRLAATRLQPRDPQTCGWSPPWGRTGTAALAWRRCSSCPVNKELHLSTVLVWMHEIICKQKARWLSRLCCWQYFTHRVALALLQDSLRQMVVENQPPEHGQVEQRLPHRP